MKFKLSIFSFIFLCFGGHISDDPIAQSKTVNIYTFVSFSEIHHFGSYFYIFN